VADRRLKLVVDVSEFRVNRAGLEYLADRRLAFAEKVFS